MLPKISIITVVRNAENDLKKTLDALIAQDYPNKELIVIDGKSSDGTVQVIQQYSMNIAYWVSEKDQSLYDAMNKGMKKATGEYLWFINAGDLPYEDHTLSKIFVPTENYADIYYGETMVVDQNGEELGLRRKELPDELTWKSFKGGMVVCHQSIIVKSDIAPLYSLKYRYAADIEWVISCLKLSNDIENTHLILSKFQSGGISTRMRRNSLKERFIIMKEHFGLTSTLLSHLGFVLDAVVKSGYRPSQH